MRVRISRLKPQAVSCTRWADPPPLCLPYPQAALCHHVAPWWHLLRLDSFRVHCPLVCTYDRHPGEVSNKCGVTTTFPNFISKGSFYNFTDILTFSLPIFLSCSSSPFGDWHWHPLLRPSAGGCSPHQWASLFVSVLTNDVSIISNRVLGDLPQRPR